VSEEASVGQAVHERAGRRSLRCTVVTLIVAATALYAIVQMIALATRAERETVAAAQLCTLSSAMISLFEDIGRFPLQSEGLAALCSRPAAVTTSHWDGPYLHSARLPSDPWGKPHRYRVVRHEGLTYHQIYSLGRDGAAATDDDVVLTVCVMGSTGRAGNSR